MSHIRLWVTPAAATDNQMVTVVGVPATAILRVDWNGHVTAAMTNTGCVPRSGDDVFLVWPDLSLTECTALDLDALAWVGEFATAGGYEPGGYERRLFEAACWPVRPGGDGRCVPA